jgi:hypothetical protein
VISVDYDISPLKINIFLNFKAHNTHFYYDQNVKNIFLLISLINDHGKEIGRISNAEI